MGASSDKYRKFRIVSGDQPVHPNAHPRAELAARPSSDKYRKFRVDRHLGASSVLRAHFKALSTKFV